MTLGQWYVRRGRIPRRTWWMHYTLPIGALTVLAGAADSAFGYPGLLVATTAGDGLYGATGGPFGTLITLLSLVPSISSSVARLHDRHHSAWWLLWVLVPLVGLLVLFVQNAILPGLSGPNRYGPPPLPGSAGSLPYRL